MPYTPHTDDDRRRMLAALGLEGVDELFAGIPPAVRAGGLDLPPGLSELELAAELTALAARNRVGPAIRRRPAGRRGGAPHPW